MSSLLQVKINLAYFCSANFFMLGVSYEETLTNSICCTAAGQIVVFFRITFSGIFWYLCTISIIYSTFWKKTNFTLNLPCKTKPEYWSFSLQSLVEFFSNFRLMCAGFTTRQTQYGQILCGPHWAMFKTLAKKDPLTPTIWKAVLNLNHCSLISVRNAFVASKLFR